MSVAHFIFGLGLIALAMALAYLFAPKGWRTFVFNGLAIGLEALPYVLDQFGAVDWVSLLGERNGAFVAAAIGLGNVVLRMTTSTPPMRKE